MIIGIWSKANFLHLGRLRLRLHFLFLLLLIVEEFVIVDNSANGWICLRRNLNQVKFLFLRHFLRFLCWINSYCYVITNQSHLGYPDVMINSVFRFFTGCEPSPVKSTGLKSAPVW